MYRPLLLSCALVVVACEAEAPPAAAPTPTTSASSLAPPEARLPDLDVRGDGSDRFSTCLGSFGPDDASAGDETEALGKALEALQPELAKCVTKDPPPGKLLVEIEVKDGKGKAGAMHMCGVDWALADCMRGKLDGQELGLKTPRTVTVPIAFGAIATAPPSRFVTGAMSALQSSLKDLHACLATEKAKDDKTHASANFHLDVDQTGKLIGADLNPFESNQDLLGCAATSISKLHFVTQGTGALKILLW